MNRFKEKKLFLMYYLTHHKLSFKYIMSYGIATIIGTKRGFFNESHSFVLSDKFVFLICSSFWKYSRFFTDVEVKLRWMTFTVRSQYLTTVMYYFNNISPINRMTVIEIWIYNQRNFLFDSILKLYNYLICFILEINLEKKTVHFFKWFFICHV